MVVNGQFKTQKSEIEFFKNTKPNVYGFLKFLLTLHQFKAGQFEKKPNKAIKNTLENLDPYTNYYDEQQVEEARIRREGEYAGIGVSVNYGDKGITLIEVYKGFEADKKGLKAGDIIIKVGNQSLENMEREQLSEMLKGAPNSSLNIEVLRQGEIKKITVVTEKITVNPVPFFDLIDDETGYIILSRSVSYTHLTLPTSDLV